MISLFRFFLLFFFARLRCFYWLLSQRLLRRVDVFTLFSNHLIDYPTSSTISYYWGFGSVAGIFLVVQFCTGLFLTFHYAADAFHAFSVMEHIMRDVNAGFLIRYCHSNGASFFFLVVYCHMARAFYYASFFWPRFFLWVSGVIIFLFLMGVAFMGYVLPWGQMSFWGATVITNFCSAIPLIGDDVALWLWGGFAVGAPTLNRFFGFHFILPFCILGLVLLHLYLLHVEGSSDPVVSLVCDRLPFFPYYYLKDLVGLFFCLIFFFLFVFFFPNALGHSDNYLEANALVTPAHIVPEWYFLPFYAILRAVPSKLGGVVCMLLAIVILLFLPVLFLPVSALHVYYNFFWRIFCGFFFTFFLLLGWLGAEPVVAIYVLFGQILTFCYFFFLVIVFSLAVLWDSKRFFFRRLRITVYSNERFIWAYYVNHENCDDEFTIGYHHWMRELDNKIHLYNCKRW